MKYFLIYFLIQFLYVFSPIPNWEITSQSNVLAVPADSLPYTLYYQEKDGLKVELQIVIQQSGSNIIYKYKLIVQNSAGNELGNKEVGFSDIESFYTNKLGKDILICPRGKFHPYDFYGGVHIQPSGFEDKGGWDLRCYYQGTGHFYMFYLLNNGKNFYYRYGSSTTQRDYVYSYFYDFRLEYGTNSETEYKFWVMRYDGADGGVILLSPKALKTNRDNGDVNQVSNGSDNKINAAKSKTQVCINSNFYFYYFTYNDASDFESGYSTHNIDFSNKDNFQSSAANPGVVKKQNTPLTFVDNVEIQEMNFFKGSKYAYYKIYNTDKNKTYYGIVDVTESKILYNIEAEFQTFIPASTGSTVIMLGLTSTTVYQIGIIKDGDSLSNDCGSNYLILSADGNKCKSTNVCDSGKIKLMPEGICIDTELCDLNVYELNDAGTECGLCKYINEGGTALYKFINTRGCISNIPNNTEYYHESSKLLKCSENYHLNNSECIPDFCFERCQTCSAVSSEINDQKCKSCKSGYKYDADSGNCLVPPTTVIIPPTTIITPPTTVIIQPTTIIISPTTVIIPPTTVIIPPTTITIPPTTIITPPTTIITPPTTVLKPLTTVIIPPTTVIIPPTTVITPPTTIITPPTTVIKPPTTMITPPTTVIKPPTTVITPPTIHMPETEFIEKCSNKKCLKCNAESDKLGLCISCDESKYKKVNYTKQFSKYVNCLEEKQVEKKYYYDSTSEQYKPCYELCKKCLGPGNVTHHNCLECGDNYMFRPGENPHNNCVVYSDYYYISPYNEYKPLNSPQCPEEAKYTIKDENNKTSCIYDCRFDKKYKYLYNGKCLKECPSGTSNDNFICKETDPEKIYISEDTFFMETNNVSEIALILEGKAELFAKEYYYTNNHLSSWKSGDYSILLYKTPNILGRTNLTNTDINFGDCYETVKKAYNITENLIIAVGDKKSSNNPSTFYLFFHPVSGKRLEIGDLCDNKTIQMKENLLNFLDDKSENYELQTALTKQGINIFDINDPYYKDLCYDFENPKNRDMALKDRIKETYVNVTLCDDGCINTGIDIKNNVASCDCKFNDITNNEIIHENAALEYLVGEIFDLVNSSNILVLKCYRYLLKYFTRSKGAMIIVTLLALNIIFAGVFFSFELNKMKRYIFSLTEKFSSFLMNYSHIFKLFPPKRKSLKNKTAKKEELKNTNQTDKKMDNNNLHKKRKQNTGKITNPKYQSKKQSSKEIILPSKKRTSKFIQVKEKPRDEDEEEESNPYIEDGKRIKKFFKDYLETSPDEMEYDDAIKRDDRGFCEFFCDCLKEKQTIAYTFCASDPINTRMIKFILFSLNITLYFVVNGLFFSESFISELYHSDEENETFFSFIPRTIDKVLYTTIVSIFIGYLTGFFFLDENKIKGIFKREKDNRLVLKRSITMFIREIQKRYIAFIIMTLFIMLISLYYILCFNYVYPKTQIEWIKSSILIIIIMQILSLLKCLFETIFRFLSFKCESEKLYKLSKIFDSNS